MSNYKRISPALVALTAGLVVAAGARAEMTHASGGRVGALRSSLGQFSQGLALSFTQGLRYDSNIVRTENSAETTALYGKSRASDWVSQTGLNARYNWRTSRTTLTFSGDGGYAKYFNFSQFSGWVASGTGTWAWNFTNRCASTVDASAERRLADFADTSSSINTFQTSLSGAANIGCFLLDRLRVSGGVFGTRIKNDTSSFEINNLSYNGYEGAVALVSAKKNEIGVHYRSSISKRPRDPLSQDIKDHEFDGYGILQVGDRFRLFASGGVESSRRATGPSTNRSTAQFSVNWAPTVKLNAYVSYERAIEDAPDLISTTRRADRVTFNVGYKMNPTMSIGAYGTTERDTLDSGPLGVLTGVKEHAREGGVYFQHTLFQLISVKWTAGASDRRSAQPLRSFKSAVAGVSIGIGF